ncbi:MAG: phenylalanine--tRNA ligase subunit beta [Cyanobacteria bacterium REEB65]|nr:phenylalanine--tRNA ligase subunit beta [Cyanobacteria bacterium REEB65]
MLVPLDWLAEKFAAPLDRDRIAEALFASGFELEAMHWRRPGLDTVVTGRILTADPHPNADRLRICTVEVAGDGPLQIVTAAPNVQEGDIVPVAQVGSLLPSGKAIGLGKLRGVDSFGMFCSATELGLSAEDPDDVARLAAKGLATETAFEFVLVLPADTAIGTPIASVLELGDCVLEIAITANRGDALSVMGLARALAAAGLGELAFRPVGQLPSGDAQVASVASIELGAPDLCPRYAAQVVKGIRIGPSPLWLSKRLEQAGIRAIHTAVDAMNYVMLDVGQPFHAFDLAKIDAMAIAARRSRHGERILTLDAVDRSLPEGTLVIADSSGPIAIAGVMGGASSAVTESTVDVLIESAYFLPAAIRRTAKALGLASESSYRFERGVDPEATTSALERATSLLIEIAGGTPVGWPIDVHHEDFPAPMVVPLRPPRVAEILGVSIPAELQGSYLGKLGITEAPPPADAAKYGPAAHHARWYRIPGWRRHDLQREVDLVEEVAFQFGYANIPEALPPLDALPATGQALADRLREALRGFGFWEVLTNSLVSPESQEGFVEESSALVRLLNPLGEMQAMRASLLPSLLDAARTNRHRGADRIAIFDVGRTYQSRSDQRHEDVQIAALAVGSVGEGLWRMAPPAFEADFFWAKGIAQMALGILGLVGLEAIAKTDAPGLHPGRAAAFELGGRRLALFGEIHPLVAERFDLGERASTAAVVFYPRAIATSVAELPPARFAPFSRLPAAERDQALLVGESVAAGDLVAAARSAGEPLLESVRVFDRYCGPQVPQGKISLALSFRYRAADRTLTDAEVDSVHRQVIGALTERFAAVIRT